MNQEKVHLLPRSPSTSRILLSPLSAYDDMGRFGSSHQSNTVEAGKEDRLHGTLQTLFGQFGKIGEILWPVGIMLGLGIEVVGDDFERLVVQRTDGIEKL